MSDELLKDIAYMMSGSRTVSCAAWSFLALCFLAGQRGAGQANSTAAVPSAKPEAKLPAFDVVSVKENRSDTGNISFNADSSGINITGAPLTNLLREAYGLYYATDAQVTGLTGWAKSERFDIKAKVAEDDIPQFRKLTREQSGALLRSILADRFQLVAHTETREMPVYALVPAKHGAKLTPTNANVPSPEGNKTSGCHAGCMSWDRRHLDAKGVGTESLAGFLTQQTQRTVVDRSGLTGKYDFSLDWAPDDARESGTVPPSSAPELLTAIQEQLGLKLDASKGPVEIVVVDRVEQPSPN